MSRKSHRALDLGEIAISDHARLRLRTLSGPDAIGQCLRHVQAEWARRRRTPGHIIRLRVEIGPVALAAIMGGRGPVRAVLVTPIEAAVMRAKAIDANAPGEVSTLRHVRNDDVRRTGVTHQQTLNQWTLTHIATVAPALLDDATVAVALPKRLTKKTAAGRYQTERWFWNVRAQTPFLLLVALARPPLDKDHVEIEECFRVPRAAIGDRKVLARYRVKKSNRTGSMLDDYRVRLTAPASRSAPATAEECSRPQQPADS